MPMKLDPYNLRPGESLLIMGGGPLISAAVESVEFVAVCPNENWVEVRALHPGHVKADYTMAVPVVSVRRTFEGKARFGRDPRPFREKKHVKTEAVCHAVREEGE